MYIYIHIFVIFIVYIRRLYCRSCLSSYIFCDLLTAPGTWGQLLCNPKLWCRGQEALLPTEAVHSGVEKWDLSCFLWPGAEVPPAS